MATYESKKYAHTGANLSNISATGIADGSVDNTEFQYINSLSANAQTQISANLPKSGGTMTGNIVFGDSDKIQMGAGTDMKIYSDGTYGIITALNGFYVFFLEDKKEMENVEIEERKVRHILIKTNAIKDSSRTHNCLPNRRCQGCMPRSDSSTR